MVWDIELNPGPHSCTMENNLTSSEISFCHLNIHSIKSKLNGVNVKLEPIRNDLAPKFNIITVSET